MKVFYDLHIHSALSPCADDDMTPSNIAAAAAVKGLNVIAVSDHNSIKNVAAAMSCGKDFGVAVIPAMEVQTAEDIHVLTLFYDFDSLESFYKTLNKRKIKNREQVFGRQLIINEDDEIVGCEDCLLLVGVEQGIYTVIRQTKLHGGVPVLAHVDREHNGIAAILGEIPRDIGTNIIEITRSADDAIRKKYAGYKQLVNSDAHTLRDISDAENYIEADGATVGAVLDSLKRGAF